MAHNFEADIAAVDVISAVPTILEVVCRTTGMGFAAIARVTPDRWIACAVRDDIAFGLKPGGELPVATTICHEIRQSGAPVVINHVSEDPCYRGHHTPAMYGFQSYISMPIVLPSGAFFGTLCAIDPRPARLNTPEIIGMFKLFAELIGFHLHASARLAASEADLTDERRNAELREQFIAVLGHDLRNPLASIAAGANLLAKEPLTDRASSILKMLQSSVGRMTELIDNVMDFARGRLGGGLVLARDASVPLGPALEQVVDELRAAWPDRAIESRIAIDDPVACDAARMAQLLSNLAANALSHGAADRPVRVAAVTDGSEFKLSVANAGHPIAPETMERLFQPFFRVAPNPEQGLARQQGPAYKQGPARKQGLGLGLYIAQEIARAHGGSLEVTSTAEETCFVFRMGLG